MTLAQLIASFREVADDLGAPPLWSDTALTFWANEAQHEAARRARLFLDSSTDATCKITITAGTASYPVDSRVIFVRRAKLESLTIPLSKINLRDMDTVYPGWESSADSTPGHWMPTGDHEITLYPTPIANDVLRLQVIREPLEDMAPAIDNVDPDPDVPAVDPEIPSRMQFRLVDWMLYRALMVRDKEEKYDPKSAKEYLASFEAEFGKPSSAIDETWINREHGYDDYEGLF